MTGLLLALALTAEVKDPDLDLPGRCGSERRAVKTVTDPDAHRISLTPRPATVAQLRAFTAPAYSEGAPRAREEKRVYRLVADVLAYKLEADQDVHVVISTPGKPEETMVIEFPAPSCSRDSLVAGDISDAREQLIQMLPFAPSSKMRRLERPIRIVVEGVGFFDKVHGQAGVAPNGIELHPVLVLGLAKS